GPHRNGVLRITIACTGVAAAHFSLCLHVKSRHLGDAYRYPTESFVMRSNPYSSPTCIPCDLHTLPDKRFVGMSVVLGVFAIQYAARYLPPVLNLHPSQYIWYSGFYALPTVAVLLASIAIFFAELSRKASKRRSVQCLLTVPLLATFLLLYVSLSDIWVFWTNLTRFDRMLIALHCAFCSFVWFYFFASIRRFRHLHNELHSSATDA
uniref:hypothetical protein n=1 Tax=Rubripirellula obstinata TaxID=406547 RepID=UPI001EE3F925